MRTGALCLIWPNPLVSVAKKSLGPESIGESDSYRKKQEQEEISGEVEARERSGQGERSRERSGRGKKRAEGKEAGKEAGRERSEENWA